MSNKTFNDLWHSTQKSLESIAVNDYQKLALEPEFDRQAAQRCVFELYAKYILVANRLEEVYDQMIQPQKRLIIRTLLDSTLGRIIELKHDLVAIDMNEFSYNDDVIKDLNLLPNDMELRIPRYFLRENHSDITYKKKFIDDILTKLGWLDEEIVVEKMSELQAIHIIQMHERARQGRLRAQFMKEIKQLKEKGKPDAVKDQTDGLVAAMRIQKVWRGFTDRRKTRHGKVEEMYLIGMIPRPIQRNEELIENGKKVRHMIKLKYPIVYYVSYDLYLIQRCERRYEIQKKFKQGYENDLTDAKEEILRKYSTTLSEQIADEVRDWFKEYQNRVGKFPEFPTEENGGSRQLLSRQGNRISTNV